ncbi:hypothetical protein [Janthinobacterium agaricidamnosum]|uniref:Uncharacterized protein n=1 Tax=Janthinobacterium agaricidamnosum NBRC 102515 = DSM 9628 TaxID=1349767 RepID=W0V0K2_9BURK|nr:hypothetical protein [Janthinobacterium agaricidamnosum]CDG81401.1 putative uncharacterized protein [Janthinobacterium agaricidamnosum NBRC 102515 = DSM 9628]
MKFNDTAPVLPPAGGPPPWLARLADDATMEATVLRRPVEGKDNIVGLLKLAIPLYEFQHFTYRDDFGDNFFMESYRSQIRGVPIECSVLVHMNAAGQADSLLINHRPLDAALLFSRLMAQQAADRYGQDLFLGEQPSATK